MSLLDNHLMSMAIFGNPVWKWGLAILITFIFFILAGFFKRFAEKNLRAPVSYTHLTLPTSDLV